MKHDAVGIRALVSIFCLSMLGCPGDDSARPGEGAPDAGSIAGNTAGASGAMAGSTGGAGAGSASAAGSGGATAGNAGSTAGRGGAGASGATAGASAAGGAGASGGAGGASGAAGGAAGGGGGEFSTDRATFFGTSRCAGAGFLVCDDFESGTLDTTVWKNYQAAPKIDSMQAARGTKALHLTLGATGGSGVTTTKIFPRADGVYYGRMFLYFDVLPTGPQWAHWTISGANTPSGASDKSELRLGGQNDGTINRFGVGTDHGPSGDWTNLDNDPSGKAKKVPEDAWICVEWMVDTQHDQSKFWWDGTEHPSLATTRDVKHGGNASVKYDLPELGSVWVGFENYNQGQTMLPNKYDVWIDEVALNATRIGCNR
jgi:hypothetical protein